jgi:hypothetical protein
MRNVFPERELEISKPFRKHELTDIERREFILDIEMRRSLERSSAERKRSQEKQLQLEKLKSEEKKIADRKRKRHLEALEKLNESKLAIEQRQYMRDKSSMDYSRYLRYRQATKTVHEMLEEKYKSNIVMAREE